MPLGWLDKQLVNTNNTPLRPMRKESLLVATAALVAFAGVPTARGDYSNTVMALNPVAYWPLNETNAPAGGVTTATNLGTLGSAFNAIFQGNVTFGVHGVIASEADTAEGFDGTSTQAQTPYSAAALSNAPSFTIEA